MLSVFHPKIKWSGLKLFVTHVIKYNCNNFLSVLAGFCFLVYEMNFCPEGLPCNIIITAIKLEKERAVLSQKFTVAPGVQLYRNLRETAMI